MDDDLEAAWQREKVLAEAREAREKALADCDDMLSWLRSERAERAEQPAAPVEAPRPVRRAVEPRQRPAPPAAIDWIATEKWVRHIAAKMIEDFAAGFGGDIGDLMAEMRRDERELSRRELKAEIDELRGEIASERAARAAEAKYAALEARLDAAEQRAAKPGGPRLIGGSDAAD